MFSLNRRRFLLAAAALAGERLVGGSPAFARSDASRAHAPPDRPWRIFYNDDSTHILATRNPYHRPGDVYGPAMIEAAVDEAVDAGIAHYVVQPGLGWVPAWRSSVYSGAPHYAWFEKTYGVKFGGYEKFLMEGGDILGSYVAACRKRGVPVSASFRLNDAHGVFLSGLPPDEWRRRKGDETVPSWLRYGVWNISRTHMEHPEWRLGASATDYQDPRRWFEHLWDWGHPEVVADRLALFSEVPRTYILDGIELDFMRFPYFFTDRTPVSRRVDIITEFVAAMRRALDAGAEGRPRRELALRLPAKIGGWAALGIDPRSLRAAGVDRYNISSHTFTSQDVDFEAVRAAVGDAGLTLELAYGKHFRQEIPPDREFVDRIMMVNDADLLSTVLLAARYGFDSVSLFNFVYWRRAASATRTFDPAYEPPWHVVRGLNATVAANALVKSWYLSTVYNMGIQGLQLPADLSTRRAATLLLRAVTPEKRRWAPVGKLRLAVAGQKGNPVPGNTYEVSFNGTSLVPANDPTVSGIEEDPGLPFLAWALPTDKLLDGANQIVVAQKRGEASRLWLLEVFATAA